ncbi:MAG TPA: Glu/Leu/Phe/Val dehydrogenase dimerization domain-containing protein [Candidatus Dormibacteraeota bacterium]|nr:Glu/Leu/Phe/Val dehydrogenase dimerization domain-containing protein [Candidatus Dormibacteraeota bacterium]
MASDAPSQYLRLTWTDPVTGRHGFLVIDRLVGGLSGGGIRMRAGCSLEEVSRLAATMSLKNGALGLPAGGAKAGVDLDPRDPEAVPLLTRFVRAMHPFWSTCVATGEDMGVQQSVLNAIFSDLGLASSMRAALRMRGDFAAALADMSAALSAVHEGRPLVDLVGGHGVAVAAAAALERLGMEVPGARVVVQGFGSMGGSSALFLARRGAVVIGVADVQGLIVNQDGLDVERLLAARDGYGVIDRAALAGDDRELPRDEWVALECDVLVPAAVADAINPANCERVRARLVVEAANLPTSPAADARLVGRGVTVVPDFVANAATNGWAWWVALGQVGPAPADAFARIESAIGGTTREMLARAAADGLPPRDAARRIARDRLDRLAAEHGIEGPIPTPLDA